MKYRLENDTRWGSAYLALEAIKRVHDRKAFDPNKPAQKLTFKIEIIKSYIKILYPCYLVNLNFQCNHSTIAEVIPVIFGLIHAWEKMKPKFSKNSQMLINLLIQEFLFHFNFEFNWNYYFVIFGDNYMDLKIKFINFF